MSDDFNELVYVIVPLSSLTDYMLSIVPETRQTMRSTVSGEPRVTLKYDPALVIGDAFAGFPSYTHEEWLEVLEEDPDWGDAEAEDEGE